jgi:hypothetical protein
VGNCVACPGELCFGWDVIGVRRDTAWIVSSPVHVPARPPLVSTRSAHRLARSVELSSQARVRTPTRQAPKGCSFNPWSWPTCSPCRQSLRPWSRPRR